MLQKNKRIRIFAGPNGSGKSTILRKIQQKYFSGPFVNADSIELILNEKGCFNPTSELNHDISDKAFIQYFSINGDSWIKKSKEEGQVISLYVNEGALFTKSKPTSYDAAMAADFLRESLLETDKTFSYETVLSHSSKLRFLQKSNDLGFNNYLYFICTIDPEINIERVKQRHKLGGHDVPEAKIIKRYYNSLEQLEKLIPLCYRAYFFDNSVHYPEKKIKPIAEVDNDGNLILSEQMVPNWLEQYVIKRLFN